MTGLVVSADTKADLNEIMAQLEEKAGSAVAERYLSRFRTAIEHLLDMPQAGEARPGLGQHTRRIVIRPYILIYDYADETVTLLRIVHARRRITAGTRHRD
jgi:plasmid stabilization system protein ParE